MEQKGDRYAAPAPYRNSRTPPNAIEHQQRLTVQQTTKVKMRTVPNHIVYSAKMPAVGFSL